MTLRRARATRNGVNVPVRTVQVGPLLRSPRSRWRNWLISTLMLGVFGTTVVYWFAELRNTWATPVTVPATARSVARTNQARRLFGGDLIHAPDRTVRLAGVLVLNKGAAAIVSVGDGPARAVSSGGQIDADVRLVAVGARSITIERKGILSEVRLSTPDVGTSPTVFVR
jgi:general secretion pathway protein C